MVIFRIMKNLRTRYMATCMVGLLVLSGCANFQITVPDSDPIQVKGQVGEYQRKTMHAFFWGLLLDPQVLAAECHGQGINDVVIHRTLAHDLAGTISLGLWMPTAVRFRCKAPPTRPGVLPVPPG
jgi:Bor protein